MIILFTGSPFIWPAATVQIAGYFEPVNIILKGIKNRPFFVYN